MTNVKNTMTSLDDDYNAVIDPQLEFAKLQQQLENEKRQAELAKESTPAVYAKVEVWDITKPLPKLRSIN